MPTIGFQLKKLPTKSDLFTLYKIISAVPIVGNNVIKLGKQMGYKFNPTSVSAGEASFYIIIPASTTG